jgi:hypothetical protein
MEKEKSELYSKTRQKLKDALMGVCMEHDISSLLINDSKSIDNALDVVCGKLLTLSAFSVSETTEPALPSSKTVTEAIDEELKKDAAMSPAVVNTPIGKRRIDRDSGDFAVEFTQLD